MMRWGFPGNFSSRGFNGYGGFGGYGGNYGWMGLVGMGIHLFFWLAIILIAIYLVRRYRKHHSHGSMLGIHHNDAMDILRERYARGEIDTEEFERRREMLSK